MLRLTQDWSVDGIKIYKGICFKSKPVSGVLSKIPDEILEEYTLPLPIHGKRKQKQNTIEETSEPLTPEQSARCGNSKLL